jgi:Domain of unknown function (DUF4386)
VLASSSPSLPDAARARSRPSRIRSIPRLHLVLIGYLAWKSGYVPRVLGVLLVIAGGGYLVGSSSALLVPGNSVNVAAFTFIGEALFMLWLLVKGRSATPKA